MDVLSSFKNLRIDNHYHVVLDALQKAASQNAELLKNAELQLKNWETEPEFYSTLLTIAFDTSVDLNIRWLAVLCIKNGVDRYWRKGASNEIPADEKVTIRRQLLTCLDEPVNQIALQYSVIISKIARFDVPKEWPELFPVLLDAIESSNGVRQRNALLTVYHVVKALASKRLIFDVRMFYELTTSLFTNIYNLWINFSKLFLQEANTNSENLKELLEKSFVTLKILKRLTVSGFKDYSKDPNVAHFLSLIFQQTGPFLECRNFLKHQDQLVEICEKYVVLLMKILRDVLQYQPFFFVQFIQPTLECCVTYCFNKSLSDRLFEKLTVQFLNLIKGILLCREYKPARVLEDTKNPLTLQAHKIKNEFFTYPVLKEICDQLLWRYFLLSEEDIANWEANPEEFAPDEGGESWKFSLRPCTEVLFLALFCEFRDIFTTLVVEATQTVHSSTSRNFEDMLRKEAIYNAVGLVAFDLYHDIDFEFWFTNILIPELQTREPGHKILKRRVIWMISHWIGVKLSPELRPKLYELIIDLVGSSEDIIVRLAAANTLKVAVDDFEFCAEQFFPYLEKIVSSVFQLLQDVKGCDLKMSVLHALSLIIERTGSEVRPYTKDLMKYLPLLWENAGDHNLLRCAIISCFVHLVEGLGTLSESLHPLLLPMIAFATDVTQPPHVYLLEDGLELWKAVLCNASEFSQDLCFLATHLMSLLEYQGENFFVCLKLTQAYVIFGREVFLKRYGSVLVEVFRSAVTDVKTEVIDRIIKTIEIIFIAFPVDGPVLFQSMLPYVFTLALENDTLPLSLTTYLSLISRVILHNQTCFGNALQEKATESGKDVHSLLGELLDVWLNKIVVLNPVENRKLMGLALSCLLTLNSEVVYERICGVLLAIVEVLNDVQRYVGPVSHGSNFLENMTLVDILVLKENDFVAQYGEIETEHDRREREFMSQDPVYTVTLRDYFHNQVMLLQESVGETKFQDLMSTVDVETMQQVQKCLKK